MECHTEERRRRENWNADQVNIVGYLHGPCGLRKCFSAELIQQACGYLEVNAFEARSAGGHSFRCIYPKTSIMAHSCVPNTSHVILPSQGFRLVYFVVYNFSVIVQNILHFLTEFKYEPPKILPKINYCMPHIHTQWAEQSIARNICKPASFLFVTATDALIRQNLTLTSALLNVDCVTSVVYPHPSH